MCNDFSWWNEWFSEARNDVTIIGNGAFWGEMKVTREMSELILRVSFDFSSPFSIFYRKYNDKEYFFYFLIYFVVFHKFFFLFVLKEISMVNVFLNSSSLIGNL